MASLILMLGDASRDRLCAASYSKKVVRFSVYAEFVLIQPQEGCHEVLYFTLDQSRKMPKTLGKMIT